MVTHIVMENEILAREQILDEDLNAHNLYFPTPLDAIRWCVRRKLLKNSIECADCHDLKTLIKRNDRGDGYRWRCKNCLKTNSIREGSFFSRSNLSLQQIIMIVCGWCRDQPQHEITHEAGMSASSGSIVDWCNFCRDVCETDLEQNLTEVGGFDNDGIPKIVEIDESKFFHRKYNRGQWREGHWVFGGVERGTGKCFLVEVPNRTAETLEAIIQQYILPGTIIMFDGWRAYNNLNLIANGIYDHRVVVHERNFVDPVHRDIHTQSIENLWMRAKRKLRRQFGTSRELFPSYQHEFIWRNKCNFVQIFSKFILCISEQYPV